MYFSNRATVSTMKHTVHRIILPLAILLCAGSLFAQNGEPKWTEYGSTHLLGGGAGTASFDFADTLTVNPASSGYIQRMTFDASYVALLNTRGGFSWPGHVFNFAHTIPTRRGVFSWYSQLLTSAAEEFNAGTSVSLGGTFARDVYPDLLVGTGAEVRFSTESEFAADLDLGLISDAGDRFGLSDVYWGAALRGLGYSTYTGPEEPLYTPSLGIRGDFLSSDAVTSTLMTDLSFPELRNVRFAIGVETVISERFRMLIGSRADLAQISAGSYTELIPSLGLSYTFSPGAAGAQPDAEESGAEGAETAEAARAAGGLPWNKNEFSPKLFFAPAAPGLWAAGIGARMPIGFIDKAAPEIEIDLSPLTGDDEEADTEDGNGSEQESAPQESEDQSRSKLQTGDGSNAAVRNKQPLHQKSGKPGRAAAALQLVQEGAEKEAKQAPAKENGTDATDGSSEARPFEQDAMVYISPNNDGVQDELSFPFSLSDSRYITGYEFVIKNQAGEMVRRIANKETRPEKRTFSNFFRNLFAAESGIQVPDSLRWDGTTAEGNVAEDGLYSFQVRAWDDNGNVGSTEPRSVYVDTTAPEIEIEDKPREERIFSPNNDGNKDTLIINQEGSVEEQWQARILNASGTAVRSFTWNEQAPEKLVWGGKNDEGILVPDGVYKYRITATDRAGNTTTAEYGNIVKNTEQTPVALTINRAHFSPNEDGVKDEVLLATDVPVKSGITNWSIEVVNEAGRTVREYSGTETAPENVVFDGRGSGGNVLPEGWYRARFSVMYRNGNNPRAESPRFQLDVTPPSVSVNANTSVFSPNGDGNKDVIVFNQETSAEETWHGYILNEEDERVLSYKWVEKAEPRLRWDGRGEAGNLLDDGIYYYQLAAQDKAGNRTESRRVRFELDTRETEVLLTAGSSVFSPNGDGRKDSIRFLPKLQNAGEVVSYRLVVENEAEEQVRLFEGSGSVPETIRWDGFLSEGGPAPDGTYRARIRVTYRNGNQPTAATQPFRIDTVKPQIEVNAQYTLFSPDGDGNRDTVRIRQDSSKEELWQGEISNAEGEVIKSAFWKGETGDFVWDGTDNAGNPVPDGAYTYTVSTEDRAGNRAQETIDGIQVDTAPTKIFVTASGEYLSPNGDGTYEDIAFNTIINRVEGLESWFLELVDETGNVQKRFEGSERVPKRIVWDGTNEDGEYVEGRYIARFGASYTKGNEPRAESLPFVLDRSAPRSEVSLQPKPFSPDNDGVDDELKISLNVNDRSAIDSWSFTIYDTKGNRFKRYSGTGSPAETLIWDGRGSDGELVLSAMDYPYEFTVTDVLGNTASVEGEIPIDVLVVREDGQLKIKISNINFQPNSAEFVQDDPEIAERNRYVLDRVAEILQKYRQYEITIEGHAVITKWYDEDAAEREQEEELLPLSRDRAERVLNALAERGVARDRLNAVGVGGKDPLVPHSDLENRWKNRRVEFILEKE